MTVSTAHGPGSDLVGRAPGLGAGMAPAVQLLMC